MFFGLCCGCNNTHITSWRVTSGTVSGNKGRLVDLFIIWLQKDGTGARGGAVGWPKGHEFDSRWRPWNFFYWQSFRPQYGRGIDSASNRNEYQEYFLGGKDGRCYFHVREIWDPQPLGTLRAYPCLYRDFFTFEGRTPYVKCRPLSLKVRNYKK